jgi:hypothetical protein
MDVDEDQDRFNDPSSLGLHRILRDVGIDLSAHDSVFDSSGAGGALALADADVSDGEDKFEDDVSDPETAGEKEDRRLQERKRATEEARWMKRAMEMQKEVKTKVAPREKDALAKVRKVWPDWERGQRMRMTEVFYDTPLMQSKREVETNKAKRRKLDSTAHRTCEFIPLTRSTGQRKADMVRPYHRCASYSTTAD